MSKHFSSINIESYRGIKNLELNDLSSINVIVGDNNVGKTSVLEAISLLSDPSPYNVFQVARQREKYRISMRMGLSFLDLFMYLFNIDSKMKDTNAYHLKISGVFDGVPALIDINGELVDQLIDIEALSKYNSAARNKIRANGLEEQEEVKTFIGSIKSAITKSEQLSILEDEKKSEIMEPIEFNEYTRIMRSSKDEGIVKVQTVQTIDHIVDNAFSNIIKNKVMKTTAMDLLKLFDSSIIDLRFINENNRFVPVVECESRDYLPLSMYGEGMKKALTILNALVVAENGVVLIDEFETAVHTSVMAKVFEFMIIVAKKMNIQLFLTTHSIEAVDKLLLSAGESIDSIRVITLKRDNEFGKILSRSMKGSEVSEDRKSFDFEVRE